MCVGQIDKLGGRAGRLLKLKAFREENGRYKYLEIMICLELDLKLIGRK